MQHKHKPNQYSHHNNLHIIIHHNQIRMGHCIIKLNDLFVLLGTTINKLFYNIVTPNAVVHMIPSILCTDPLRNRIK